MLISKQRRLRHFELNALASLVVIFFIQFKADEVPLFLDAGDSGSAAAHKRIEDGITFQARIDNMFLKEWCWLYGWMIPKIFL